MLRFPEWVNLVFSTVYNCIVVFNGYWREHIKKPYLYRAAHSPISLYWDSKHKMWSYANDSVRQAWSNVQFRITLILAPHHPPFGEWGDQA